MSSRRKARILAFQALYAYEVAKTPLCELTKLSWVDEDKRNAFDDELKAFTSLLISGTIENLPLIDSSIKANIKNWDFERLTKVDLAILRISTYTLHFQKDVPPSIVIDEGIEIAKEFGSPDSFKFINGVLDGIRRSSGKLD